ncbi:uncharacterized protein LOC120195062 [Hibiscus syriacus]|uniref:uncharacterized protein LOC120195062 n=1 Tax=Hibiscus syriacus TaxID=106335 RepID=UPI0019232C0D|nr:uncharacterized protein LOC120195062 [Hibiscus syriacus]
MGLLRRIEGCVGDHFRDIIIETDNRKSLAVVRRESDFRGASAMSTHLDCLLDRDWCLSFKFVPRERNRLADGLGRIAWSLPFGLRVFQVPPTEVHHLLQEDFLQQRSGILEAES